MGSMSSEHIMMVEDDKLVLSVVTSKFRAEGYQVTEASSVSKALQAIANGLPDLLVLDLTLLDGDPFSGLTDGFAFLRLVQRNHPDAQFLVVIYSVDNSPAVQAKAQQLGVAAIVHKGSPVGDLLAVVRTVLDERKAGQVAPPPEAASA